MISVGKFLSGVVLLILLGVVGIHMSSGAQNIERKIRSNAEKTLLLENQSWARVLVDGQKVSVTGFAPSERAFLETQELLLKSAGPGGVIIGGVTIVDTTQAEYYSRSSQPAPVEEAEVSQALPTPSEFAWRVSKYERSYRITGHTPSAAAQNLIVQSIKQRLPDAVIEDMSTLAAGMGEAEWITVTSTALTALEELSEGSLEVTKNTVKIDGPALPVEKIKKVEDLLSTLPDTFSSTADLTPKQEELDDIDMTEVETPTLTPVQTCQGFINDVLSDRQISFESSQAIITTQSRPSLDLLSEAIAACDDVWFRIIGHTDSSGFARENFRLSELRALAVKAYLVRKGIDEDILFVEGMGASDPIASNASPEGRSRNRRIEVIALAKNSERGRQ